MSVDIGAELFLKHKHLIKRTPTMKQSTLTTTPAAQLTMTKPKAGSSPEEKEHLGLEFLASLTCL